MFNNWISLITTECCVIMFEDGSVVYPIFKNGQSSLFNYAKEKKLKILKNKEISKLKTINIFLRDPIQRFVSGVHTVIELEKIKNINLYLKNIEKFKTYNRHFVPQFYWLIHLLKYFKGNVKLLSVDQLYNLIPNRDGPKIKKISNLRKKKILSINNKKYVEIDYKLMENYLEKTVNLETIIKEFKNEMPTT